MTAGAGLLSARKDVQGDALTEVWFAKTELSGTWNVAEAAG